MNQNLCSLLSNVDAARRFVDAAANRAEFKHDAQNMCGNAVIDPGKKIKDTLLGGARFTPPARPTIQQTLLQTAALGDPNKVLLLVIGLLFSSADLRTIVTANTPRVIATAYFEDFHDRVENAKIGTEEEVHTFIVQARPLLITPQGILPDAVLVARERIKLFSLCAAHQITL